MKIGRRTFLVGGTLACTLGGSVAAQALEKTEELELVEVDIPVRGLPAEFEGYRIGFLTDIHYGVCISPAHLSRSFAEVLSRSIDLLLLGGDYIYTPESPSAQFLSVTRNPEFSALPIPAYSKGVFEGLMEILRSVKVPDGVFGVLGNHDRWCHPTACDDAFAAAGIPLLENAHRSLRRGEASLVVAGVADYLTGRPEKPAFHRTPGTVGILLCHNPDFVSELLDNDGLEFDLALCGHTHGGQIRVPGLGALITNIADQRFVAGLAPVKGGFVYTSRGIGVVEIPYRIACAPEATVITLRQGS